MSRKIIAYLATSADGFIARPDGDVEWLNRRPDTIDYGMKEFYSTIDTILWGRGTYDWVLDYHSSHGIEKSPFDSNMTNLVFSRNPPKEIAEGVEFVSEPLEVCVQKLRQAPGKDIWMMGGAGLIASFLDVGAIDEFDLHVIPVLIGEGIPLIAPGFRDIPLRLRSSTAFPDGVLRMQYVVER